VGKQQDPRNPDEDLGYSYAKKKGVFYKTEKEYLAPAIEIKSERQEAPEAQEEQ